VPSAPLSLRPPGNDGAVAGGFVPLCFVVGWVFLGGGGGGGGGGGLR